MLISPHRGSRALALAIAMAASAAACSSSSGGGNSAPAAGSEIFHNVSPAANHLIQRTLALMPGVGSVTYQNGDLLVLFKSSAVKLDQTNVENVVRQDQAQASAAPSPSATSKRKK